MWGCDPGVGHRLPISAVWGKYVLKDHWHSELGLFHLPLPHCGMREKPPFSSEVWGSINAVNRLLMVMRDHPISPKLPESLTKVHQFLNHILCAVSPALLGMSPDLFPGFKQEMMAQMLWQKWNLSAATPEVHLCDFPSILRGWDVSPLTTPAECCKSQRICRAPGRHLTCERAEPRAGIPSHYQHMWGSHGLGAWNETKPASFCHLEVRREAAHGPHVRRCPKSVGLNPPTPQQGWIVGWVSGL